MLHAYKYQLHLHNKIPPLKLEQLGDNIY
jgi:hypothetical protein